jgi:hypothetical protein
MKKYKMIRIDLETYNNFKSKQSKVNKVISRITGKPKRVPFSKVLKLSSSSPMFYMGDSKLLKDVGEIK